MHERSCREKIGPPYYYYIKIGPPYYYYIKIGPPYYYYIKIGPPYFCSPQSKKYQNIRTLRNKNA